LRKDQERLNEETTKKDLEIDTQNQRIRVLKRELAKEKYGIG